MRTHIGYRMERHNAHMAAVWASQRRGQLQRVQRVIAQHEAWRRAGILGEGEADTLKTLYELRDELVGEMRANGQEP